MHRAHNMKRQSLRYKYQRGVKDYSIFYRNALFHPFFFHNKLKKRTFVHIIYNMYLTA